MKIFLLLFGALLLGNLTAQDLQEGLVIHYPLDGNLTDTISSETAENFGNMTFEAGLTGSAVRFFNQDAYFVTPRGALQVGPQEDGGSAGTFSLFVNHRGAPLDTDRQNYIAQKNGCGPEDTNRGRVVLYRQNPEGASDPDSLISFITGRPLRTNYKLDMADTWIHLTLTMDPEIREWAFFVDGVETRRDTFVDMTQAENSCGEFVIGHHLTFTNEGQTFDGLMDDLRFYNRVLSQEEITMLANPTPSSLEEQIATNSITITPNPVAADHPINIDIDRSVFRAGSAIVLNIVDVSGRTVMQQRYDKVTNTLTIDHSLVAGIYTVTLTDGEQLATKKVVIR